jgi:hypothetical protein
MVMGDEAETRWVTYSELGRARGISRASAERLARKKRWPRMKDNMGLARVAVPLAWLTADEATPPVSPHDRPPEGPQGNAVFQDVIRAFEGSLGTLRDALDRANERADAAEQGREVLREQIATLRADLSEAQDAADRHHAEAQAAQERADRAEGVRDSALEAANRADAEAAAARGRLADMERDNDARRALGRLARLRDAWRGRG